MERANKAENSMNMGDLERQVMNNEYLAILKDPQFNKLNVNFLEF